MYGINGSGFNVAIVVLAIMFTIGGIALGIGYAVNSRKFKDFGREELNQCIINGVLISSLVTIFLPSGMLTSLINSITSNSSAQCPSYLLNNAAICFSYGYLAGNGYTLSGISHPSILYQSTSLMAGLFSLNALFGVVGSVQISAFDVVGISLSQAIAPITYQLQNFIKILGTVAAGVLVQSAVLSVIAVTAVNILLPLGIVLRTFYPTRKLGGFLVGTVIGLYVVLPLTYVLNASVINSYTASFSNSTIANMSGYASGLAAHIGKGSLSSASGNSVLNSISSAITSISGAFSSFVAYVVDYLSYLIIAAFVLPAFSIALTYLSIREISGILGSEMTFNLFDII
jgi:hypothetical protein